MGERALCLAKCELPAQSIRGKASTARCAPHQCTARAPSRRNQMDPAAAIALWSTLFVVSHLVISSQSIRPRLVERIGELSFRGIYSLVAFGTLIPLW